MDQKMYNDENSFAATLLRQMEKVLNKDTIDSNPEEIAPCAICYDDFARICKVS